MTASYAWSVVSGGGTITSTGLYTAPATSAAVTVRAANGTVTRTASIQSVAAPAAHVGAATARVNEGSRFERAGTVSDADADDVLSATVDYDDGLGHRSLALTDRAFQLTHTFPDNGARNVVVRVTDPSGETHEQTIVLTVDNVAPTVAAIADVDVPWDGSGGTFAVDATFTDPGADTFTGEVDYGSGYVPVSIVNGSFALNHRYDAPGTYAVSARVTDDDGGTSEARQFNVRVLPPPAAVATMVVNDGAAQRSMVNSLTLTFDRAVNLSAGALRLERVSGSTRTASPATLSVAPLDPDVANGVSRTWLVSFSGTSVIGGSLADGPYEITVDASVSRDAFGQPMTGGNRVFMFHRYFGDYDGNRTINNADYGRFQRSFGSSVGQDAYQWSFDFDGNRTINNADYAQFQRRFGKALA
jgi:hypothetical protein